jgi:PAS domain-containing protein
MTDDRKKLRAEAEARFARAPRPERPDQPPAGLLHELQVHQIELEMQNEDLRRNQLELEQAHDRQIDLYDVAPVGYVTLDEKGVVTDANLTAAPPGRPTVRERRPGCRRRWLASLRQEPVPNRSGRDLPAGAHQG